MKYTIVRNGKDRPRHLKMSHQFRSLMKRMNAANAKAANAISGKAVCHG